MSRSTNLNLERLRRQLENSTNVNVLQEPKRVIRKSIVKKPVTRSTTRSTQIFHPQPSDDTTFWNIFYILISVATLFFIGMLLYNLYVYYHDRSPPVPEVIIEDKVKKDPKGVIIDQEGAPISVEKGGDITENKYLSLNGSNNFILGNRNSQYDYGQYASYPGGFSGGIDIDFNGYNDYGPGYGSQSDDGVTKIYYKNVMNSERSKMNNYIRNQNDYIRNINRRVRQINSSRMNTPTYSRDEVVLQEIRNYERRLANQVHNKRKNQPYLPDQNIYYQ